MKKFFTCITILLFLISLNTVAFAASNTYSLDELGLDITIPSEYSVITRDTPASDPIFDELGTTKSAVIDQFENGAIYLNAISDTYNEEIVVTMQSNSITNFSLLSDTALGGLASNLKEEYANYGYNITSYEIYQHPQAKFIKINFNDTGNTVSGIQYYTVYDGKAMNFTLRSYENDATYSEWFRRKNVIENVVKSITYYSAPPVSETQEAEEATSFVYTENDSGVKFTVPDNWKQKEFTGDREYLDAKFVSTKEAGCIIIFGCIDIWEQMPSSEKSGYNRIDINNSFFSKSDIAEMYGVSADEISVVTYNGIQYYKGEIMKSVDEYGINISITMTQLVHINDGWVHIFQFGGTDSHTLYSDFESLLNSVIYPSVSSDNLSTLKSFLKTGLGLTRVIIVTIATIVVIAIIIYRKKKTKISKLETADMPSTTILCKNCGEPLPLDSEFCHICGAKINEEEVNL